MSYLLETIEGESLHTKAAENPPMGPGFSVDQLVGAEKMEIIASSFDDPGEDWNEFRLIDESGATLATKRVAGC